MHFSLFLVVATFVTGLIWLLDVALLARRRRLRTKPAGPDGADGQGRSAVFVDYARSLFPVLLAVLVLRAFLFEPFHIPSGSMEPTLLVGDFLFVNKFAYGLRLPVIHTKILDVGEPKRGDVVVFRYPRNPKVDFIKRVIGLPGDVVFYDKFKKRLTINGKVIPIKIIGPYPGQTATVLGREQLGAHDHLLLLMTNVLSHGGTYVVPKGHYFVMGDNRDNSDDSRYWGFVPEANLVGRATVIWMSWIRSSDGGPGIRWRRIGHGID